MLGAFKRPSAKGLATAIDRGTQRRSVECPGLQAIHPCMDRTFNSCHHHRPVGYQELTLSLLTWMDPSAIARSLDQAVVVVTSN